jgi:hypothetical protein
VLGSHRGQKNFQSTLRSLELWTRFRSNRKQCLERANEQRPNLIIPGVIAKQQLKKTAENGLGGTDEESQSFKVAGIYQTQLIVALSMLEAAAFFNLVAMLVEKNGLNLIVVVVFLSLMLMKFPTRTKVSWWVQDRLTELNK